MANDHELNSKGSSDTLRTDLPMPYASTASPTVGASPGWGSPFTPTGTSSDGGFEFGVFDAGPKTSSSNPSKWATSHKLSKQNLAAFGAKIQSTAAHATSKYKSASKSNSSASFIMNHDAKDDHPPAPGQLLKSKMFRQSKTDLKSLSKIKPPSAIMSDRSPTIARSSKEIDRIGLHSPTSSHHPHMFHDVDKRHHHPHMSFLKRDSPAAVLSSNDSTSRLTSEGTIYSFHTVDLPAASVGSSVVEVQTFRSSDECAAFAVSSWAEVTAKMAPVFEGAKQVLMPIEITNIALSLHFAAHYKCGGTGGEMLERVNEMLVKGLSSGPFVIKNELGSDLMRKLSRFWHSFYTFMLPEFVGTFLPLQLEMDGLGQVLRDKTAADEYWKDIRASRLQSRRTAAKQRPPDLRQQALIAFRDTVVVPVHSQLALALGDVGYDPANAALPDVAASVLQCISVLALIQSNDASQKIMDKLVEGLNSSWVSRPRVAKDRRGLVTRR